MARATRRFPQRTPRKLEALNNRRRRVTVTREICDSGFAIFALSPLPRDNF
jgi:hypothetical protein